MFAPLAHVSDALGLPVFPPVATKLTGPVLVAVDSDPAPSTLEAAAAVASHLGLPVVAVSVGGHPLVAQQLNKAWAGRVEWHLQLSSGEPARVIAEEARRCNASLVVMGKGQADTSRPGAARTCIVRSQHCVTSG